MRARLKALKASPATYEGAERSGRTPWTWLLNVGAGVTLLTAGGLL